MENSDNYIFVPEINLYVAKEKKFFNLTTKELQEKLKSENKKILTPFEFLKFLKYTKENFPILYNEITETKKPWRSEALDAEFKLIDDEPFIIYHTFNEEGNIIEQKEKLGKEILLEDKAPGISLEDLILNSTKEGLPKENIAPGKLFYYSPRFYDDCSARFDAVTNKNILNLSGNMLAKNEYLGAREAKFRL